VKLTHDLALMKLGRNIERDSEDVKYLARQGFITSMELKDRYEKEMRPYIALAEQRTDPVIELWVEMIREELRAT
jgi:G:T-mismatch repair DNA endonuclease (very short patch repair protein)